MRMHWRIVAAIGLSLLGHLGVLLWWTESAQPVLYVPVPELAVTLVPQPQTAAPPEVVKAEPEPPPVLEEPAEEAPLVEPDQQIVVTPDPAEPDELDETPVTPLNLQQPEQWDNLVDSESAEPAIEALPFNPELHKRATVVRQSRARQALIAARGHAVHGLSDEQFGVRAEAEGQTIKRNGRCYTLRESEGLGDASQWWFAPCLDPRRNPLTLELLEFDGVGRVIAD